MNHLKRYFITLFILLLLIGSLHTLMGLLVHWRDPLGLAWLGAGISVWPWFGFFLYLMVSGRARIDSRLYLHHALAATGTLIAFYAAWRSREPALAPVLYALGPGFLGGLIYARWYSRFPQRNKDHLQVGTALPPFTLSDLSGTAVSSASFKGTITLLLFYRGNWCPLCVAQVKEIAAHYRELEARGARVILVSPQPQSRSRELAERCAAPMEFMVDQDNQAARALGIAAPGGVPLGMDLQGYASDTVLPTVLISDARGIIRFADLTDNYRLRPDPATFLRVLDEQATQGNSQAASMGARADSGI